MKVVSEFESEMATINFNLNGTQDSLKTVCTQLEFQAEIIKNFPSKSFCNLLPNVLIRF